MYGVCALASEFLIGDSTIDDMTHHAEKTSQVRDAILFGSTIVVPEHLLINVAIEVERFDANICALQSALEQAPEVSSPLV